jgi:hypothetical protein
LTDLLLYSLDGAKTGPLTPGCGWNRRRSIMRSASRSVVVRVSLSCYTQILKKFFRRSWRKRIPSTGYLNHLIGAVDRIEHSYIVEDEGTACQH